MENISAEATARRVAGNSLALVVRFAARVVSKFLIVVVIARWLGVEEVGDYTFVMTFTLSLSFLNHFGLGMLLTREIAQQRERLHEYLGNALLICLGLGLFSLIVMGGLATWLGYSEQLVAAVYLASLATLIETLSDMIFAAFAGYERMELGTGAIVTQEVSFLIIGAVVMVLGLPFLGLFVLLILSRLIGLIASIVIYWRIWGQPVRLRFDPALAKILGRKTLPFAINVALSPVFARIDILLLSYFKGNVAVGYYEVASTLFYRLNVIARMVNTAIMPLIAREYPLRGPAVIGYVRRAVTYQALTALPITLLCWVLGEQIIIFIFGPEFAPSVVAFQIMASITFLRFIDHAFGVTLTAIDRQGLRALATALMAFFNVAINLVVLPRYSYLGAAVTSVLTEIGYFILLYSFVRFFFPNPIPLKPLLKSLVASVVMALPLLLLRDWSLLLLLPLAVLIYGLAALATGILKPAEIEILLKIGRVWPLLPLRLRRMLVPSYPASRET